MKKNFVLPKMEVIRFEEKDIVVTSSVDCPTQGWCCTANRCDYFD